jgi:hypothetical protein
LTVGFFDPKEFGEQFVGCYLLVGRKNVLPRVLRLGFRDIDKARKLGFGC